MEQEQIKPMATETERCRWHEIKELLPQYSLSSDEGENCQQFLEKSPSNQGLLHTV